MEEEDWREAREAKILREQRWGELHPLE